MIKVFDSIIRYIVEVVDKDVLKGFGTNREELFSWLKSIRPQKQWKPSEKQMEVLVWCMPLFIDPKSKAVLKSLIKDLEKL